MDLSALDSCTSALAQSNGTLHASLTTLSDSLSDYPRLLRILQFKQSYELVSEDEIRQAQLDVQREVEPQIRELIARAEGGLSALQRRERSMHERVQERKRKAVQPQQQRPVSVTRQGTSRTQPSSAEAAKLQARLMSLQTLKENLLKTADRVQEDVRSKKLMLEAAL